MKRVNERSRMSTVFRLALALAVIFSWAGVRAQPGTLGVADENSPVALILQVDTSQDTNDPTAQVCSAQPQDCSLRGAISKANSSPGDAYIIELPTDSYNLSLADTGEDDNAAGDLDIHVLLSINGAGSSINGQASDRVLDIRHGARVILRDLTITGGKAPNDLSDQDGGGIRNLGDLTLENSDVIQNAAGGGIPGGNGGNGGGIFSQGYLAITADSSISQNKAGDGINSLDVGVPGGAGGNGGGIYSIGSLTIEESDVSGNTAGLGGNGLCHDQTDRSNSGQGGSGGGIYGYGALRLLQANVSENIAGSGGAGGDCDVEPPPIYPGSDGSNGGSGGGIYFQGALVALKSVVSNNQSGKAGQAGSCGGASCPVGGNNGAGGGIYSSGTLLLQDSSVEANVTGIESTGGPDSHGGDGGGIYFLAGTGRLLHSQVTANRTGDGNGGAVWKGGCGSGGPGGSGGGIFNQATLALDDVVVQGNITGGSGNGGWGGSGGGIYNSGDLMVNGSQFRANRTGQGGGTLMCANPCEQMPGGDGGGIFNDGSILLTDSVIEENQTGNGGTAGPGGQGGGIFNQGTAQLIHAGVSGNHAGDSGEVSSFTGNSNEGGSGGGLFNSGEMSLAYTSVLSNTTGDGSPDRNSGSRGGLYSTSALSLNGVSLVGNQVGKSGTGGFGAGIYLSTTSPVTLANVLLADNTLVPGGLGSGMFVTNASVSLWHTTLARNTGGDGSGIHAQNAGLALTNTILVSHTVGISITESSMVRLNHTLWGSDAWANGTDFAGSGQITHTQDLTGTVAFVAPGLGDYHIGPDSDALDQGTPNSLTTDMDNQPRPNPDSGLPDLGVDEYWVLIPLSEVTITGPISGTALAPLSLTAVITPDTATPNIYYTWIPQPLNGQGSSTVTYTWQTAGQFAVTVTAQNFGSIVQAERTISVNTAKFNFCLPIVIVYRGP